MEQAETTAAATGPLTAEQRISALETKLAKAEAKVLEFSDKVEKAIEKKDEKLKEDYKEREAHWEGKVKEIKAEIAELKKEAEENAVHNQMAFLKKSVLGEGHTGFVYGPPGTGKSNTTLAFCLSNETQEYVVTWIHFNRRGQRVDCLQIKGNSVLQIQNVARETIDGYLSSETEKHLVVLDGYADNETKHGPFLDLCCDWFKDNKQDRRLVVVSSMSSLVKVNADDESKLRWKEHVVCSWEYAEYEKAVANNSFFDSVKQYLDADDVSSLEAAAQLTGEQKLSLLAAKYYFAGGSSRFMFSNSTEDVMEKLNSGRIRS